MAIGDDATAALIPLVPATADVRKGYDHHNETRDIIARRVTPVTRGGTGAGTAAEARTNLGIPALDTFAMRNTLGFSQAIAQLSAHNIGIYYNDGAQRFAIRKELGGTTVDAPLATEDMLNGKIGAGGGTITGQLYLPNASPAVAGYAVAYINNDGRISKGASSERYKKHITAIDPASLGDIFPQLHRFQMRQGEPGAWKYGWIAERLAEQDDTAPFVVHNEQGVPESIDFIALLIAQNAQLHQALDILTQRIDALEADRAAH